MKRDMNRTMCRTLAAAGLAWAGLAAVLGGPATAQDDPPLRLNAPGEPRPAVLAEAPPDAPRAALPDPGAGPAGDEPVELTRGPVHEAFAQPVVFDPEPGEIVPKQPPEAIEEVPPEEKPEGEDVVWIPGYWSWDDDSDTFLWVSGLWRMQPPGYD